MIFCSDVCSSSVFLKNFRVCFLKVYRSIILMKSFSITVFLSFYLNKYLKEMSVIYVCELLFWWKYNFFLFASVVYVINKKCNFSRVKTSKMFILCNFYKLLTKLKCLFFFFFQKYFRKMFAVVGFKTVYAQINVALFSTRLRFSPYLFFNALFARASFSNSLGMWASGFFARLLFLGVVDLALFRFPREEPISWCANCIRNSSWVLSRIRTFFVFICWFLDSLI